MKNETKVGGFITEEHKAEIESTFGKDLAAKVETAEAGSTFLSILFADFAK